MNKKLFFIFVIAAQIVVAEKLGSEMLYELYKANPFNQEARRASEKLKQNYTTKMRSQKNKQGLELYQRAYILEPYNAKQALTLYQEALDYLSKTDWEKDVLMRIKILSQ